MKKGITDCRILAKPGGGKGKVSLKKTNQTRGNNAKEKSRKGKAKTKGQVQKRKAKAKGKKSQGKKRKNPAKKESHPVINWIESSLKCSNRMPRYAAKPVVLMGWQKKIIRKVWPESRKFVRRAEDILILTGKKTGKTEFGAYLASYILFAPDNVEPQPVHWKHTAPTLIQSEYFDRILKEIIKNSDLPAKVLAERIEIEGRNSYEMLSGEGASKQGLNYTHGSIDEAAEFRDPSGHFLDGQAMQDRPFSLYLSNPPENPENFLSHLIPKKESARLIKFVIKTSKKDAENFKSPAVWRKSNPSLGVITPLKTYQKKVKDIALKPAELVNFQRLWLCHHSYRTTANWVSPGLVKSVRERQIPKDLVWYGGIDLSTSKDLTSFCLVSEDDSGRLYVRNWNWIPRQALQRREDRNTKAVKTFLAGREKNLFVTKGETVDLGEIEDFILSLKEKYPFSRCGVDRVKHSFFDKSFRSKEIEFLSFSQQPTQFTAPIIYLEEKILKGQCHVANGNPVWLWGLSNVRLKDAMQSPVRMFYKTACADAIDPVVASAMGTGLLMKYKDTEGMPTVWEL